MKIIQELIDMIDDELEGAEEYAHQAVALRAEHPTLAKTYYEISLDEVKHINMLHDEVRSMIEHHRREHGEPPAAMMAIYDYGHKKNIEEMAEIKAMQAQYTEHSYK